MPLCARSNRNTLTITTTSSITATTSGKPIGSYSTLTKNRQAAVGFVVLSAIDNRLALSFVRRFPFGQSYHGDRQSVFRPSDSDGFVRADPGVFLCGYVGFQQNFFSVVVYRTSFGTESSVIRPIKRPVPIVGDKRMIFVSIRKKHDKPCLPRFRHMGCRAALRMIPPCFPRIFDEKIIIVVFKKTNTLPASRSAYWGTRFFAPYGDLCRSLAKTLFRR